MTTSPLPITWYNLRAGCTRFTKQVGHAAYIIDETGLNILRIALMHRVNIRLFNITQVESVARIVQSGIESLINEGEPGGRLYGILRFYAMPPPGRDSMWVGLAYSTGELTPDFEDPDWNIMTESECCQHGLPTWKEPEGWRVSRFEREWVI